ncbi:MAG TPA: PIG-L family deacetylase, partial [Thermoguttaceae bacterium]
MNVLTISVHPDDETLGSGGTLLRHKANGDSLYWLIVTQAHQPQWSEEVIGAKAGEVSRVAEAYGMKQTFKLGLPTTCLDTYPKADLINRIRPVIAEVKPEVVYLTHDGDVHTDHQAVFQATFSILKAFYMRDFGVRRILSYETLSSTEAAPPQFAKQFIPNVYQDITAHIERKIEIMNLYATESQPDPFPRGPKSVRSLARYRGATIGV